MRKIPGVLLILMLVGMLVLPGLAAAAENTVTVQDGDTLTSIAARYGTTVDALVAANGLGSANLIFVGQTLVLPGGGAPAPAPAPATGTAYWVQAGDFLSVIAAQYGVAQDALMAANGLTNPDLIFAGQRLTIPGAGPAPAPPAPAPQPAPQQPPQTGGGGTYTVLPGESLADIAAKNGVTVDALIAANDVPDPNIIYTGQVLNLPKPGAPAPAAPTPRPAAPTNTLVPPPPAPTNTPQPPAPAPTTPPPPPTGSTIKYTVQPGDRLYGIAAAYNTTVDAIIARNGITDPNTIYSGQVLTIVVGDTTTKPAQPVQPSPPSPAPPSGNGLGGKWIDVNLSTEMLTAYEGNNAVFSSAVSTGIAEHPTVVGTFKIYVKYVADDMSGGYGAEYYYLPAVPYVMYFYGGYAIHGTYWHHNFGHPMSHGCVNLPTPAAEWMFNWAPVGTPVVTHW